MFFKRLYNSNRLPDGKTCFQAKNHTSNQLHYTSNRLHGRKLKIFQTRKGGN